VRVSQRHVFSSLSVREKDFFGWRLRAPFDNLTRAMAVRTRILVYSVTALLCGCEKSPEPVLDNVKVTREITLEDTLIHLPTTWSMTLRSRSITFFKVPLDPKLLSFDNAQQAKEVFDKFSQWSDAAEKNKVEPFSKKICDRCVVESSDGARAGIFSFSDGGHASLSGLGREDIQKFSELLEQFPAANAELQDRLAKAKSEAQMFK
jgi:hypothetical protein